MKNLDELKAKYEALGREIEQLERGAANPLFIPKEGDIFYNELSFKFEAAADKLKVFFRSGEYAKNYVKSREVLKRFHAHPLAVPIEDDVKQYLLWGNGDIYWYYDSNLKTTHKSPIFSTKEDCEKAVADIGMKTILQAYKDTSWSL